MAWKRRIEKLRQEVAEQDGSARWPRRRLELNSAGKRILSVYRRVRPPRPKKVVDGPQKPVRYFL